MTFQPKKLKLFTNKPLKRESPSKNKKIMI